MKCAELAHQPGQGLWARVSCSRPSWWVLSRVCCPAMSPGLLVADLSPAHSNGPFTLGHVCGEQSKHACAPGRVFLVTRQM